MYTFAPDTHSLRLLYHTLCAPVYDNTGGLSRKCAPASMAVSSVKVLCLWAPGYGKALGQDSADYTIGFWESHGFQTWRWDYMTEYLRSNPLITTVYEGTLEVGNGYAHGTVYVRGGATNMVVAFCQNSASAGGDSIALLAWATYHLDDPQWPVNEWTYTDLKTSAVTSARAGDTLRFTGRTQPQDTARHVMRLIKSLGSRFLFMGTTDATFTYNYMVDTTEVTQEAWQRVMGSNPSINQSSPRNPVENITWYDMVRYCSRLSFLDTLQQCYDTLTWMCDITRNGYRLPTSAEWEYATRAGTTSAYFWGGAIDGNYLWYGDNSGTNGTYSDMHSHEVATKLPNPWGLYDMVGNLWEACNDWYGTVTQQPPLVNYTGPSTGTDIVMRGGQFGNYGPGLQWFQPAYAWHNPRDAAGAVWMGFRCCRTVLE
jgi:hypothetical protein